MADYVEKQVDCGGVMVNYASWPGDGPDLLLIHGLSSRWQSWMNVVPMFRRKWSVKALDLRGHGRTSWAEDGYPLTGYARDVERFIEQVYRGPVRVIGHSLGGMTAMTLAATAPSLVTTMVLEDPPVYTRRRPERRQGFSLAFEMASSKLRIDEIAQRIVRERPEVTPDQARGMAETWRMLDPETVGGVITGRRFWGDEIEETMRKIKCPTLLLQADSTLGGAMQDDEGDRFAELVPSCALVRWPGCGHGMHSARPSEFVEAANQFFENAA